ncbi:MAG: hypothetical protein IBX43_01630 [Campylobacterales bacterium]|nr:hypothetical protein [Campylobacterales bacterium]
MNLDTLKEKTILLLGKSRALEKNEFLSQLEHHKINCAERYSEEVELIVEGRMLNPIEHEEMEALHKADAAPFMAIDELEKALCAQIDSAKLHMSLKLSGNQERLLGFIQNNFITDELFLRLLSLYDWKGESFFENDENRDTTAALIKRFYKDIEKNHNVQYATTGLLHLIMQTEDAALLETISSLEPIKKALQNKSLENGTYKILQAIALHPKTSASVIKSFVKCAPERIKAQIAGRADLSETVQKHLHSLNSELLTSSLAKNSCLEHTLATEMLDKHARDIALHIALDEALFALLLEKEEASLALNPSLSQEMIAKLFDCKEKKTLLALASNPALQEKDYERLYTMHNEEIANVLASNTRVSAQMLRALYAQPLTHISLAGNRASPVEILRELSLLQDEDVLTALSKNTSTPVDILCQLQLDKRYDRYVKENESFGKHIQNDNIGWL